MIKIDGFARVVTDYNGKIIGVNDHHFDHPNLNSQIGGTEIKDAIYEIKAKDSEVLIPLMYFYQPASYAGGYASDPEEIIDVLEEYVLRNNFKEKYLEDIKVAWKDEHDWRYVHHMIADYEEWYGEKIELEQR